MAGAPMTEPIEAAALLPCPFCGGEATIERKGSVRQSNIVACTECGCRLESGDVFNPASRWNSRRPAASGDLREWIARIVDPLAAELRTALDDAVNEPPELRRIAEAKWETRNAAALAKADTILASLPGRDEEAIRAEERERCAKAIPDNWCDSLLTGKGAAKIPMDCPGIERLLKGVAKRIRSLKTESGS
jgi:predicted RNA-binding Zn-ribbon protein involved in translation (DUF1610 family)